MARLSYFRTLYISYLPLGPPRAIEDLSGVFLKTSIISYIALTAFNVHDN